MRPLRPRSLLLTCVALCLLAVSALPAWSVQIDDAFISLAYARGLVDRGLLQWGAERVEGYSNLLQVVLLAPALAAGIDPDLWARGWSLIWAGLLLILLARRADRRGAWLVAGIAGWAPLGYWACAGMELTLYALLLVAGWGAIQRQQRAGPWLLLLAAWARPEGAIHLIAGAAWAIGCGLAGGRAGQAGRAGIGALAVWGAYHAIRLAWFGAWWPTPFLVKVAENEIQADILVQSGQEILCMGGLALLGLRLGRPAPLTLLPLLIQGITVLGADVDWMGHGRLWLPGAAATAALWIGQARAWGRRRGEVRLPGWALAAGLLGCWLPDPPGIGNPLIQLRPLDPLLHPLDTLRTPLETPTLPDLEFLIRHAPDGAVVLTGDVGMAGHLPWIRVVDLNGLTSLGIARWRMGAGEPPILPGGPRLLRRLEGIAVEPWMGEGLALHSRSRAERFPVEWWVAGSAADAPTAEQIAARWAALRAMFPSQGALWLAEARARIEAGDVAGGLRLGQAAAARWPIREVREARAALLLRPDRDGWRSPDLPDLPLTLRAVTDQRLPVSLRWRRSCEPVFHRLPVPPGPEGAALPLPPPPEGCGAAGLVIEAPRASGGSLRGGGVEVWLEG